MVTYPADWKTYPFKRFFKLIPNNTLSRDKLSNSGLVGNIHYGDVLVKYGNILSGDDSIPRIREDIGFIPANLLQKKDVVLADTAEDEIVGKVTQIGDVCIPLVGGLHTVVCRPNVETADGYLGYYMNSKYYHDQLLPYITGIKVSSVSKKSLNETELTVPANIEEQKSITTVFQEMDYHIANLSKLIEKKRGIRDGALEDLMTGRTRIGGFHDDWDNVALGTQCDITSSKRVFEREWTKSGIPFLRTRDIASFHTGEEQKDRLFISEETYREKVASSGEPHKGDLLVTGVGTIGLPYLIDTDDSIYFKDGNILWIKKNDTFVPKWLYFLFMSKAIQKQITDNSGFTTVGTFTIKNAKKLSVPMPSVPEQEAIADVLTVMDEEIAALETQRDKMIQIREGAMDDLLTGRVRLTI